MAEIKPVNDSATVGPVDKLRPKRNDSGKTAPRPEQEKEKEKPGKEAPHIDEYV